MRLGKYQLLRKLATGGMAEVFLAKTAGPRGFEKQLVIKRILPHLAEDPEFVEMFLAEAKLAAQLNHPNLVQIFDFGEAEGSYFIAMEYIDGPTVRLLLQRARERSLAVPFVLGARIVSAAAEGLAYAHEFADLVTYEPLQLIHRDVSPDNILISRNGAVKVVDFGIAKARGLSHHTQTGTIKGKVAYMAPEQLRGEVLDRRVDLYGLGVVLYELLTLNMPYAATSDAALVRKVLYDPYFPPAERRPELPLALQQILSNLLAKNRDERYSDCRALHAALERFILATGETSSGFALSQFVQQLVPPVPVGTPVTEPEMPILTPSAISEIEPGPGVFPLDAPEVDVEAKTAVAAVRPRRTAPEGFAFPIALEAERAPIFDARVDLAHGDLHGTRSRTEPRLTAAMRRSPLRPVVWLLVLGLLGGGAWLFRDRILPFLPAQVAALLSPPPEPKAQATAAEPPRSEPAPAPGPAPSAPPAAAAASPTPVPPPASPAAPVAAAPAPASAPAPATIPPPVEPAPPSERAAIPPPPPAPAPKAPAAAPSHVARAPRPAPAAPSKKEDTDVSKLLGAFEAAEANAAKKEEATGEARIRFESNPPLRVRVGNRIVGTTPVVVRVPEPGPVDVELFDNGLGLTRLEHVDLRPGDNGVRQISFGKGAIDFKLQAGITVYVDAKKVGVAPFAKPIPFYEGKHPVRLVLGDQEERRLVTVTPGETETLEFTFER